MRPKRSYISTIRLSMTSTSACTTSRAEMPGVFTATTNKSFFGTRAECDTAPTIIFQLLAHLSDVRPSQPRPLTLPSPISGCLFAAHSTLHRRSLAPDLFAECASLDPGFPLRQSLLRATLPPLQRQRLLHPAALYFGHLAASSPCMPLSLVTHIERHP